MKTSLLLPFLPLPLIQALVDPPTANTVARNSYTDPRLNSETEFIPLSQASSVFSDGAAALSDEFGILDKPNEIKVDIKSGRVTKLDMNVPLFPGDNRLLWRISPTEDDNESTSNQRRLNTDNIEVAITALQSYIGQISPILSIDPRELFTPNTVKTALHSNGNSDILQFSLQRTHQGITVRDSRAYGVIKNGNLIMFGLNYWSDVVLDMEVKIDMEEARVLLSEFAEEELVTEDYDEGRPGSGENDDQNEFVSDGRGKEGGNIRDRYDEELKMEVLDLCTPELQILILDNAQEPRSDGRGDSPRYLKRKKKHHHKRKGNSDTDSAPTFEIGTGYKHALVWRICPRFTNQKQEIMEGLVDAHTGEIYSFVDKIDYFTGMASVYPVSNDGQDPDGILQPGYPMPFMAIKGDGSMVTSDTGGNYWSVGEKTVSFTGEFVHMVDQCGEAKLTVEGDFDWSGVENGTDCDTPGFGGDGNTQASRSGYYELNRIIEIARSHLPGNGWLKQRLTANMNIPQSCNAYWDGSTVNFYRSSEQCSNTGEIAGVFDHEWAHGMDNNDLTPTIVKPSGEGIADIYTALRLGDSCIGRGFFNNPCSQFGDPCINDCTGVRDIDYEQHLSKSPHTLTWTNAKCGSADNVHCRGLVYSEAVWSLWKRDLPSFYGYDDNTALEIVMRLTFIAAGNVATWYSGSAPFGGCGGDSGYLSYLLADDDDGDITNGTPHMQAIYAAHNRQEIACDEPPVQDSGCNDSPRDAPQLTVTPGSMENFVSWTAVTDASYYQVFRTEGVYKCSQGKVLVATVSSDVLNYTDTGLMNGRSYYYIVIPKGSDDACFGPGSECLEAAPLDGPAFQFTCESNLAVLNKQTTPITTTHQCTVFSVSNFTGTISLSCDASAMEDVDCTVPSSVAFSSGDEYQDVPVTLDASLSTPIGQETLILIASDGSTERKSEVSVVVVTPGGNQTASYDPIIRTPRCVVSGSECSSGDLLDGKGVDEANAPNVLLRECNDGIWGEYHVHPSNDKIVVKAGKLDGSGSGLDLTERSYATVSATVWSTFATSCFADFYFTNNITNPTWEYIGTQVTSKVRELEVLQMDYELPVGLEQAVRVNFRYKGSAGTCPSGGYRNYGDVDDLVYTVKESAFYISCPDSLVVVDKGDAPVNITKNCTLHTASSFSGTISFSCDASAMTGTNCIAPSDVSIESGGQEMHVSYVVEATDSVVGGEEEQILVYAESSGTSKTSSFVMLVLSSGGSQKATYDPTLGAPRCFAEGSECVSGDLLDGRGDVGPEPNAPNSLDTCTDGNSGDYRVDEQSDAITVRAGRLDGSGSGGDISEGEYITIAATVFAYNTNDRADFWHAPDAYSVEWQYIGSIYSEEANATEVIEIEYKLPQGSTQAVRVKYDYQGNITTCRETAYGDVDDIVFAVKYVPFYISCPTELLVFNIEEAPITAEQPCTIYSQSDFEGSLEIDCDSSGLSGVECASDSPIDIELGTLKTNITVSMNISSSAIAGESGDILITATDPQANITKTSPIQVLIIEGGGPQTAEYDSTLGAPRCYAEGSSCSSGELLDGRGEMAPGEPNQPNTLDDCIDGSWGNYHAHPSIDVIEVKGKNGNVEISEYDAVTVSATVWATMPDDLSADFYYTSTPEDPDWIFIDTLTTSNSGEAEVLEVDYNLPSGTNQAVRVHFRYLGSVGTCPDGNYWNYGDADDLVFAVKQASFSISCPDGTIRINKENTPESIDVDCSLSVSSNYNGTINLSCSSASLTGINCTTPTSVDILSGDTEVNVTVTLDAGNSVVVGEEGSVLVSASDEANSKTSAIGVSVVGPGGDQVATFDSSYGTPFCDLTGKSCSSGDLLFGRGPVTPEPNQPNTLDDCEDGAKGEHHSDESIDAIVVRSGRIDGESNDLIREGEYVTIVATVWAYSPQDSGDFFIATNPADPSWQYIGSVNATQEDAADELVLETVLPKGLVQAVRVNFHYRTDEDISPCLGGSWDDVDDMVFTVEAGEEASPSAAPSLSPTNPTATLPPSSLTTSPTLSSSPTESKAENSTVAPTSSPIEIDTSKPSVSPTISEFPSASPTVSENSTPTTSPTLSSSPTESKAENSTIAPTSSPIEIDTSKPSVSPTISEFPSANPTLESTDPPSNPPPTASPSASPTRTPSVVILMSSSIDWNIACGEINDNQTLIEIAQTFELSIQETLEPGLHSDQEINAVITAEICGMAIPDHSSIGRRLQDSSSVYFLLEVEEACDACESNSTVAENLFEQVNNDLNTAVNNGDLTNTLHANANANNLTVLSNATVAENSTKSDYTLVTSSPTTAPSKQPSESPSASPTIAETHQPSSLPSTSTVPTEQTPEPSKQPSESPSASPTVAETHQPSTLPSISTVPTEQTPEPSKQPSASPTTSPSSSPSTSPTVTEETPQPSKRPSASPTTSPSTSPSSAPSASPTVKEETPQPTKQPSKSPSQKPSVSPTNRPSTSPSSGPSASPTVKEETPQPSKQPSKTPSKKPSLSPSANPTISTPAPTSSTTSQPSQTVGWYMQFSTMKCYQDCSGDYPCGGPKEFWNDSYSTLNECCISNLGTSDPSLTNNCLEGGE